VWVALVPLLFALDGKSLRASFGYAYLTGFVFFAAMFYWFIHVTWVGALLLIAYLALYFGVFGAGYWYLNRLLLKRENSVGAIHELPLRSICLAALWVSLEFIRGHLFSGFDWAGLGHSQYKNLVLIQIAEITGVSGISFLIVFVNLTLKDILTNYFRKGGPLWSPGTGQAQGPALTGLAVNGTVCVVLLLLFVGYGIIRLQHFQKLSTDQWRVAVVQANVPQDLKGEMTEWPENFDRHAKLTFEAAKQNPDLIIWPETSLPGYMWETDVFIKEIRRMAQQLGIPILVGAVTQEYGKYFNSAVLISADGSAGGSYDKIHLVPFGEYVPLRGFLPRTWESWIPVEDFSSGKKYKIFSLSKVSLRGAGGDAAIFNDEIASLPTVARNDSRKKTLVMTQSLKLSALICFEDTLPRLVSRFADEGAQVLVNITNDGWFKDTKAPFLHLQAAVFRTVENRRWLLRAANTGVSCAIDPSGRITDAVSDSSGKETFISGWKMFIVNPHQEKTFYMACGDVFVFVCFGVAGLSLAGFRRHA